jgi:hypothetical protein
METIHPPVGFYVDICNITNKNVKQLLVSYDNFYYYNIIYYDKDMLCYNDNETRLYRTVIYSFPEHKILGYLPPKGLDYRQFKTYYPTITNNIQVCEYINGEMINLFYDVRCDKWHLITQANISKTNIINKFKSAFHINENDYSPILDYLPRNKSYTFVLKDNLMKNSKNENMFYLISVYDLMNNIVKYIPTTEYENWSIIREIEGIIYFPKKYEITDYDDIDTMSDENDGFIIKEIYTGATTKILNANTIIKRKMSTINPYYTFEYLCLRRIDKVFEYNQIYQKTKNIRYDIHNEYERLVTILHQYYMNLYVLKQNNTIPTKYNQYVRLLHTRVYIPSIKKGNKIKITRNCVKEFLNVLNPSELLFLLYR